MHRLRNTIIALLTLGCFLAGSAAEEKTRPAPETAKLEMVVIVFGSSSCALCKDPKALAVIKDTIERTRKAAAHGGKDFRTIGVALDEQTQAGWDYLRTIGPFDEYSVGSGWRNHVFMTAVSSRQGPIEIPQVIIMERRLAMTPTGPRLKGAAVVDTIVGKAILDRAGQAPAR